MENIWQLMIKLPLYSVYKFLYHFRIKEILYRLINNHNLMIVYIIWRSNSLYNGLWCKNVNMHCIYKELLKYTLIEIVFIIYQRNSFKFSLFHAILSLNNYFIFTNSMKEISHFELKIIWKLVICKFLKISEFILS